MRMFPFDSKKFLLISILIIVTGGLNCSLFRPADKSYSKLVESLENLDTSPLEGRVIVLDPGHGGYAPGAVGAGGLEEKNVNLGVALRLKYYLENAQARVIMTRSDDRDLIVDRIDSLRGDDLDYRVRLPENVTADLFISLHHNSRLPLDRKYNAIETYYKMEDFFSSKDAARLIHKHLVRNLQIPLNFFRPGNYYVLRNNTRTAVLGEASYISDPGIEKKLTKSESIDLEAKSYFLGILDYFSRGIPQIQSITPEKDTVIENAMPVFKIPVLEDRFGDGIDPQSILIGINDNEEILYSYDPPIITAAPTKPLTNGSHKIFVNVANLKGNHSLLYESRFIVDVYPAHIILSHKPESIPPDGMTPIAITARVIDKHFNAVRDSTPVYFNIDEDPDFNKTGFTQNGIVHFYYSHNKEAKVSYTIRAAEISERGIITVAPQNNSLITFTIKARGLIPLKPLKDVRVDLDKERFSYSNSDGYVSFSDVPAGDYTVSAHLPGYYPVVAKQIISSYESVVKEISLEPMYNGSLFGRKILIDPEFGGLSPGSISPSGLQAADENMETALYLVQYLRSAGADAQLTIGQGDDLSLYSRVRLANEIGAELVVSLRHTASSNTDYPGISTYAYPTSSNGKRLGILVLRSFRSIFNVIGEGPIEAGDYVLQQTGCPALIINLGNISNPLTEERLYETMRNRLEAYTVFTALVNFYAGDDVQWGEFSGIITEENGMPVDNALISLDQTIILQTGTSGEFKFIALEPRSYSVSVQAMGYTQVQESVQIAPLQHAQKNFTLIKSR